MDKFAKIGFIPADILLPKMADLTKWSVVACDQYTSQPEYWQEVARITEGAISTLDIIFPEVYLENGDEKATIEKINSKMQEYISKDIFQKHEDSFIYVEREFPNGKKRCGIVGAIDLESYDYSDNAKSAIRATEKTVVERL
ncbi:MAG: DUF1015 domain-containing protein, partial [Oscillospiraceae bacterium]|nr:DUF1015 domain-containing protein [Oscillospiraceae bacterium]